MLTLNYVHDPMCSWCWAFRPQWLTLKSQLPERITIRYLLGGLAPDNESPMPAEMQASIQSIWRQIQQTVPGTKFNFDFWTQCSPKRSTYLSCRAVLAAKTMNPALEEPMIESIQRAYYLQAKNPSDPTTLIELANQLGLDETEFSKQLNSDSAQTRLLDDIATARNMGAIGFPSLYLSTQQRSQMIIVNYNDGNTILKAIERTLSSWKV